MRRPLNRTTKWIVAVAISLGALVAARVEATVTAGNEFYRVHVQDVRAQGLGQYTATTGPSHPSGSGLNVIFGNGQPGTTFNTIRSFTTNTDYVQGSAARTSQNAVRSLNNFGTVTPIGTTGFRSTYVLPGPPTTPDALTIIQDVNVNGTTFSNSTIEITTTVINNGAAPVNIGIRYMIDYQVAADDGPTFQQIVPNGPIRVNATEFLAPAFLAYRIEDNDVNPNPPTFSIFGTVSGPSNVVPTPTAPSLLQFAAWGGAFGTAFDHTIDPSQIVAVTGSINDSAVLYFFGHNATTALTIPPGGQRRVSASLFLTPAGFQLPEVEAQPCEVGIPTPQPTHTSCITRSARFWFTHAFEEDPACATLLEALTVNGGGMELGFICLPVTFRNFDDEVNEVDALMEALGLFWKSTSRTGEIDGSQNLRLAGSRLCRARKLLAAEMVAATANVVLLGTDPANCTFTENRVPLAFSSDILQQAGDALRGARLDDIQRMTLLLRKFNNSGRTSNFTPASGLVECSANPSRFLRSISRDPTLQTTCPGRNDSCRTAQPLASFPHRETVDLRQYRNNELDPTCAIGGKEAIWVIAPPVAAPGRRFLVETMGSNFDTVVSVRRGQCEGLVEADCNDDADGTTRQSRAIFTTNGTDTYFIVVEGKNGAAGRLKLSIISF